MTAIEYNRHLVFQSQDLNNFARSLTGSSDSADDLVQETMLKALRYRQRYTPGTNFKAWLFTIMKNTFINDYRRRSKMRSTFSDSQSEEVPSYSTVLGPNVEMQIAGNEIRAKIEALPESIQIPLNLHLEGFKYEEIADQLDLPIGTVKSRIHSARQKIQNLLPEYKHV